MSNNVASSFGGSSLKLHTTQDSFDVRVDADIIALLKYIHQNNVDADLKNHLRDLIFIYRQDKNDAWIEPIKDAFSELGLTIVSPLSSESVMPAVVAQKKNSFGSSRAVPIFSTQIPVHKATPTQSKKVVVTSVTDAKVTASPISVSQDEEDEEVAVKKTVQTKNTGQETVDADNSANSDIEAPAVPAPSPVAIINREALQARILEIKRLVNEQIGNPVHLIESDEVIGRGYMNALLDAMKKVNGGRPDELLHAVEALEQAYIKVQTLIGGTQATFVPLKEDVAPPLPERVVSPSQPQRAPLVEVPNTHSISSPAPTIEKKAASVSVPEVAIDEQFRRQTLQQNMERVTEAAKKEAAQEFTPKTYTAEVAAPQKQPVVSAPPDPVPQKNETPHVDSSTKPLRSVAADAKLQELLRTNRDKDITAKEQKEKAAIAAMDPLQTPEITAGLSQLLSEWSLFKSSGFFGTGPSGKDHVLYLKLAPLTMATVIAGRFEGVTPLIKQSITDYMNGWRYEEGIVHEHGETFEHYLRKVVYHIVSKKKQSLLKR